MTKVWGDGVGAGLCACPSTDIGRIRKITRATTEGRPYDIIKPQPPTNAILVSVCRRWGDGKNDTPSTMYHADDHGDFQTLPDIKAVGDSS